MAARSRVIESFLQKFKYLWSAGIDAHFNVETYAGQAWVSLHLRLGHSPGPLQTRNSPARQRCSERREAERKQNAEKAKDVTGSAEEAEEHPDQIEAGKVSPDSVEEAAKAKEAENATNKQFDSNVGEKARSDNVKCDQCDSTFGNTRGLKVHKGRVHKIIPQLDGFEDELDNDCEYTFESDYGEEDIQYTLEEMNIASKVVSRVKIGNHRSANHLCTISVSNSGDGWQWPIMNGLQKEVIKNLKRSPSSC